MKTPLKIWKISYEFTNEIVYEESRDTETSLYVIRKDEWSTELNNFYNIKGIKLSTKGKSLK